MHSIEFITCRSKLYHNNSIVPGENRSRPLQGSYIIKLKGYKMIHTGNTDNKKTECLC